VKKRAATNLLGKLTVKIVETFKLCNPKYNY
jgi:dual specificity protein kinase YAK1